MLSVEQNKRITQTGPETALGKGIATRHFIDPQMNGAQGFDIHDLTAVNWREPS